MPASEVDRGAIRVVDLDPIRLVAFLVRDAGDIFRKEFGDHRIGDCGADGEKGKEAMAE